jgi:hypothetical protein
VLALEIVVEFKFEGGGIERGGSLKEEAIRRRREFKKGGSY